MSPQVDDEDLGRAPAGGAAVMERDDAASPPPPSAAPPRAPRRRRLPNPRHPWVWLTVLVGALLVIYATVSVIGAAVMTRGTHEAITVAASSIGPAHEEVSFPSRIDRLTLRGWLFHAEPSNGRSVVMVNGFRNNRVNTAYGAAPVAHDLLQHGYDVLLFDLRSCGESDGDRFTMGNLEPRDLLGAYDFMKARGYAPTRMVILGVSLGASTELQAASQMKDVGAMVADSAFAALRPVIDDRLGKESPLPRFFDWGIITAGSMLFNIDPDLRPVDSVRALGDRAFLFFQASGDDWFPPSHARELFAASANPQSRLVIVETQGHAKTYRADPAAYMQTVYAFVDQQITQRSG